MHINVKHHQNQTIVQIDGVFLSEPDQEKFRSQLKEIIAAGNKNIVVDLSGVEHINSCGLGSLVCGLVAARQGGGELSLMNPAKSVQRLLEITKLDTAFHFVPAMAETAERHHISHH